MNAARRSLRAAGLALLLGCAASHDVMKPAPAPSDDPVADRATVLRNGLAAFGIIIVLIGVARGFAGTTLRKVSVFAWKPTR